VVPRARCVAAHENRRESVNVGDFWDRPAPFGSLFLPRDYEAVSVVAGVVEGEDSGDCGVWRAAPIERAPRQRNTLDRQRD
jgi:hypothetical protein